MHKIALAVLISGWIGYCAAFVNRSKQRGGREPVVRATRSKRGIVLHAVAIVVAWGDWSRWPASRPRVIASMVLVPVAIWCVWESVEHLGKQWRLEAGLNADHELVQGGPYRLVRHPIYTSLFAMLLATGLLGARWRVMLLSAAIFVAGTEIRTGAEEELLEKRFGDVFRRYRSEVRAYIPRVR